MRDAVTKKAKKPSSPLIFAILAMVFATGSALWGGLGLASKLLELISVIPGIFIFAMFLMTFSIVIAILIAIPLVIPGINILFILLVDLLFAFMALCAVVCEIIPFILAFVSVIFAIIAIIMASKKTTMVAHPGTSASSIIMGILSIALSLAFSAVLILPAIIWALAKIGINIVAIVTLTKGFLEIIFGVY